MTTQAIVQPAATQEATTIERQTLRLAGVSFLVGGVITGVFNALHPLPGGTVEETLHGMLGSGTFFWKFDHLMLVVGFWLFAVGFAGIHRSLLNGAGALAARLGFYGVLATTAAWTVHAALDGFARIEIAAGWDAAAGPSRDAWLAVATSMQHVTDATFPMITVFYWLSLGTIGGGIARSARYPTWLGALLVGVSGVLVGLGLYAIFQGFSSTWDILFATFATLTVLWALAAGVTMLRKPRAIRAGRAGA